MLSHFLQCQDRTNIKERPDVAPGSKDTAPLGRDVAIADSPVSDGRESLSPPQQAGSRELQPEAGSSSHQPAEPCVPKVLQPSRTSPQGSL